MKRVLNYLLVVMLMVACLGCGNDNKKNDKSSDNKTVVETKEDNNNISNETVSNELADVEQTPTENQSSQSSHTHTYSTSVTSPTCSSQGYTTYKCNCGHTYNADYISAKGHTEVIDNAVEATTTTTGLTQGKHCSVCGIILVAQQSIPKKQVVSSLTIEGSGGIYEYSMNGRLYGKFKITCDANDYSIVNRADGKISITFKVHFYASPDDVTDRSTHTILFGYEIYDAKGACVAGDTLGKTNAKPFEADYERVTQILEPGAYTLKFKSKIINY